MNEKKLREKKNIWVNKTKTIPSHSPGSRMYLFQWSLADTCKCGLALPYLQHEQKKACAGDVVQSPLSWNLYSLLSTSEQIMVIKNACGSAQILLVICARANTTHPLNVTWMFFPLGLLISVLLMAQQPHFMTSKNVSTNLITLSRESQYFWALAVKHQIMLMS